MTDALVVEGVRKSFGRTEVLRGIDLAFEIDGDIELV